MHDAFRHGFEKEAAIPGQQFVTNALDRFALKRVSNPNAPGGKITNWAKNRMGGKTPAPTTTGQGFTARPGSVQQSNADARKEFNAKRLAKNPNPTVKQPQPQPQEQQPPQTEGVIPWMKRKLMGNQPKPAATAPTTATPPAPTATPAPAQAPANEPPGFLQKNKATIIAAGGAGALGYAMGNRPPPPPQTQSSYQYY